MIEKYNIFKRDRNWNRGGVMILVDITCDAIEIAFNNSIIKAAWCSLSVFKEKFVCGVLYIILINLMQNTSIQCVKW